MALKDTSKNQKITLMFFLKDLNIGGAEVFIVQLSNYLLTRNYKVKILTLTSLKNPPHDIHKNIKLITLEKNSIRRAIFKLIFLFKKENFDIFIANVWPLTLLASFANLFSLRKRTVLIEHGILTKNFEDKSFLFKFFQNLSIFFFHNLASQVIAVSNSVKEDLIKKGVSPKKVITIYNSFRKLPTESEKRLLFETWGNYSGLKLISIANLKPEKNLLSLIGAVNILHNKFDIKAKLLIVGDGPEKELLQANSKKFEISESVIFSGFINNPYPYLNKADILVLSSLNEGFGISIIEALSLGKAVVATDCEGPSEILNKEGLGFLCKKNNVLDLAETILLASKSDLDKNKLKLRSKDFSIEKIGAQYENVFQKL